MKKCSWLPVPRCWIDSGDSACGSQQQSAVQMCGSVKLCSVVGGVHCAGVVVETTDRCHMSIQFDDLPVETVAARYVLPRRGALARPTVAVRISQQHRVVLVHPR